MSDASETADPGRADVRAQALVLFHSLRQDLEIVEADLGEFDEARARDIILRAINLLPDYEADVDERSHIVIERTARRGNPIRLNLQDAIDSLRVVWRDYRELVEREELARIEKRNGKKGENL
ncbi:MAG: hypothetical protein H7A21_02445 [Spirochaetales bacterium]|nr:hypothetical protein [Leptospiraceae bacterium]MCP5480268.1 hypothetical protein [Spirochaetales bacterium]MCP5486833.1 hypothetical protein [Spirochaetales bacterium]